MLTNAERAANLELLRWMADVSRLNAAALRGFTAADLNPTPATAGESVNAKYVRLRTYARSNRVTIRSIAERMDVSMVRVREVFAMTRMSRLLAWEYLSAIEQIAAERQAAPALEAAA